MADPRALDPADPRGWQPMRPYRGRRTFDIRDPIVEPFWSGTRVVCHVAIGARGAAGAEIEMIEELGADVAGELPALRDAVAASVAASDAVIDGVVSRQVGIDGVGAAIVPEMRGRPGLFLSRRVDLDVVPRGTTSEQGTAAEQGRGGEPLERDGFIAVDLLRVDGTSLLDVPLLERKRLLESVISPGDLVRTSVHVRPPIETWIVTWKSLGLRGGILKAANGRYLPGQDTTEWRIVERVGR